MYCTLTDCILHFMHVWLAIVVKCSRSRNPDDPLPSFWRWRTCRITTVDLLHRHRLQGSPYGWWPHHCHVSRQWINSRACPCHDIRHEYALFYPVNKGGLYLHWGLGVQSYSRCNPPGAAPAGQIFLQLTFVSTVYRWSPHGEAADANASVGV